MSERRISVYQTVAFANTSEAMPEWEAGTCPKFVYKFRTA